MKTEKLYYEDRYLREFSAEVLSIVEKDGLFHVVLDKTAFFPGGGGQPCDIGFIENIKVIDVYENSDIIYHVLEKKLIKIHKVKCIIDWEKRFDSMKQHLAQHVLSGCFYYLFNLNTVSFHLGSESCTVDIVGVLSDEQIKRAEVMANEIINENIKVDFLFPTKSELKKLKLRRDLPKTNSEISVLKVGDLDINACCGVHPDNTSDLGIIKIIKSEKNKGNTRIEYLSGGRASKNYVDKWEFSNKICKLLKCGEKDVINIIENFNSQLKELVLENRELKVEISEYKIKEMVNNSEKIKDIIIVENIFENKDVKYIGKIAEKICLEHKAVVIFAIKNEEKVNLIFSLSKNIKNVSMNELLKDAIYLIDGKGGGSDFFAQGAGKNNNNLNATLEYAINKIKAHIN